MESTKKKQLHPPHFFVISHTLPARPRTAKLGSASWGAGEKGRRFTNTKLNTSSHTQVECEDRFWDSEHINTQRYIHREASSVKASVGPGEHWGEFWREGSYFQSPEPPLLVSQCSLLEQWERRRPQETSMTFGDLAARIASI